MKKLFAAFIMSLLLISSVSKAQEFVLSTEVGQGFIFKDYQTPQYYSFSSSVNATMEYFDSKLRVTAPVLGVLSDGESYLYGGVKADYRVFQKNNYSVRVGGTALTGSEGRQLYGICSDVEISELFYITTNVRQEYKSKSLWFDAGVGFNIIK